jgi:hypothetical protein
MLGLAGGRSILTLAVWVTCIFLESLILFRSYRARIFNKYSFFCVYLACVIATELSRLVAYRMSSSVYLKWYWGTQFACLIVGCGILFDILDQGLSAFAGAETRRIAAVVAWPIMWASAGYSNWRIIHPESGWGIKVRCDPRTSHLEHA